MNNTYIKQKYILLMIILLTALLYIFPQSTSASEINPPEEVISAGAQTYYRFCSVCHGETAKGDGQFSENMKVAPPDLTTLTKSNNGVFPWIHLYSIIDGTNISKAHGSKEMPIWGDLFNLNHWSSSNMENATTIVHGRIFELLLYLNSIQVEN